MHRRAVTAILVVSLTVLVRCSGGMEREVRPAQSLKSQAGVEVIVRNLEIPWALAIAPDGRLFVTERPGRIRLIVDDRLEPLPFAALPVAPRGEGGLLGLALDPAFAENRLVYVYYTYEADGRLWNQVVRLRDEGGRGVDPQVLLDRIPGAVIHNGGRLKFGPDGKLYITTGEAAVPELAQDLSSLGGKILRLNADGSIPPDNPFPGSPIYSFGHRNPQGLAWHPDTGRLYATEHGPSGEFGLCCHDEVNLIVPGGNYGWPRVAGKGGDRRFIDPIYESGLDTWAPSGAAFTTRSPWRGILLFAALRGQHLQQVTLGGERFDQVVQAERLLVGQFGRLRDVVEGPDGAVYLLTSNRDGRGEPTSDDDRLVRLIPSLLLPNLKVTLSGCTTCRPGDRFIAQVTLDNPTAAPVPVEVKVGMRSPDGQPFNTLGDKHIEGVLPVGTLGPLTILDLPLPPGLPPGTWQFEGALLEPELGKTLSRDAATFTVSP